MMVGRVVKVNYKRGLVLFKDDGGNYGYFEVLGSEDFETDDIIIGDLRSLGGEVILKQSTEENVDVFIEDYDMSYEIGMKKVFGKE